MDAVGIPATLTAIAGRLALAALLGAIVGLNRERVGKPAGLRTHALVALGAAQLTIVGLFFGVGDAAAPSRMLQGVITGVGFIGAGVILHRTDARGVQGLTTAAAIWVVAAIGIAAGAGLWRTATTAVGMIMVILIVGEAIDRRVHKDNPPG